MESSSAYPLGSLAMNYIVEACPSSSPDEQKSAFDVLKQRMDGTISGEEANLRCTQILGSAVPAERINAIMDVPKTPIAFQYSAHMTDFMMTSRQKARNWTTYEDHRLLAGILRFGLDNWPAIAEFVGNGRNRSQCSQRWNRGLNPTIYKGPWTKQEESELIRLVKEYGEKSWKRIATFLGNRSDVQCRYHYQQMQKGDLFNELYAMDQSKSDSSSTGTPPEGLKVKEEQAEKDTDGSKTDDINDSIFDLRTDDDFWGVNLFDRMDTEKHVLTGIFSFD